MGMTTVADQIGNRDTVWCKRRLRQQAKLARQFLCLDLMDRAAIQLNVPLYWLQQTGQTAQKGGLAAGVCADDSGDLAGRYIQVELPKNGTVAVPGYQMFRNKVRSGHFPSPDLLDRTIR